MNQIGFARRTESVLALLLVCSGEICQFPAAARAAENRPNILIITADNLGYGDLRCFNADSPILTPHLDRLAAAGAKLTDFYSASPTCTVSRACLLTGRVAQRHGLVNQLPGIKGNYGVGLNPDERLIPQVLAASGYACGCFGKWNIGFAPGSRPTERGFGEFFGHASGNIDYYTHNYNHKHDLYRGIEEAHDEGYSTDLFADAASAFIRRHAGRPWFVYLPFNAPHFPNKRNKYPGEPCIWQAPNEAFAAYGLDPGESNERLRYRAVVTALDTGIGRVLQTLDELGLADNTFVFFCSDNGAFMMPGRGLEVATNEPLHAEGVSCWEGNIRVAALARWPGRIPPASVIREPLWSPDLFVACARLAGARLPTDRVLDGINLLPVLTGDVTSPDRSLYFSYRKHAALRMGEWKIVRTAPNKPWKLFHLASDVGEQNDLAGKRPQRLQQLADEFSHWEATIKADAPVVKLIPN
jgi:arylsulfatase A-like enzyme